MIRIVLLASVTILVSLIITPFLVTFAKRLNATDKPNERKVHSNPIPTLGGIAIFVSFLIGLLLLQPVGDYHTAILTGAFVIIALGFFDDVFELPPKVKLAVQLAVASFVVFWGGLQMEFINLPFGGEIEFGFFSSIVTVLWIVGITNAINLIDGLDGLAAGVSAIALLTLGVMAVIMGHVYVAAIAFILFFSTAGFLPYNFYPAKIFMGDTGALFLGYMIAVLALLGFKNVTVISFIIPIFIVGVPISDTLIAIVRRFINRQPIGSPDSAHLHHRLIRAGFTHRQTVLFIYALNALFCTSAIFFSMTTVWGSILIFSVTLLTMQVLIENLELINSDYKPLTNFLKGLRQRP
ncbi:MraY family glycosyltransferase [Barrientosiimonas marina]|uniref:Glycosyltransferase family 4 protein n=1 Tax=Lentibacillus kimchii TaxID=1542911 RepID=A0ABW2UUX8_9BACI